MSIRQRRERLVEMADAQRRSLALCIEPWRGTLAVADRGVALARYLRSKPLLLTALAALVVAYRPKRLLRWASKGFALWRTWRFLAQAAHSLAARGPLS